MELRQLRYFVTLAEELHFGRAAAREHIVQSALSQQVQRLERELGVRLLDRSTHHVGLTLAGAAFLVEARQILDHVSRAKQAARAAVAPSPTLRAGIIDAGYDSMPQILREVQRSHPDFTIHQVEAGPPEQYRQLADGRLDIGIGRVSQTPPGVAAELHPARSARRAGPRRPPLRRRRHRTRHRPRRRALAARRGEPDAGAQPVRHRAVPVGRIRAHGLRGNRREHPRRRRPRPPAPLCALHPLLLPHVQPAGHGLAAADRPVTYYPWSLLWRDANPSRHLATVIDSARRLAERLGWLQTVAGAPTAVGRGDDEETA